MEKLTAHFYEAPIVPKLLRTIDGVAVKSIGCDDRMVSQLNGFEWYRIALHNAVR